LEGDLPAPSVRSRLCKACSERTSDAVHDHPPDRESAVEHLTLGIAAPAADAEVLLDEWLGQLGLQRGPVLSAESAQS